MATVYLGLGTNLGDRAANLRAALAALAQIGQVEALSKIYETRPLYITEQPAFLNMAARLKTSREPLDLLQDLKRLETEIGRVASVRFGPRLIDLDILLYDDRVIDHPDLEIPHPRMPERHFALIPLADIAGNLIHPTRGMTIQAMLATLPADDGVSLVTETTLRDLVA